MTKVVLTLSGLTCPSCLQKIEGALSHQPGVKAVKVLFNSSKVKAQISSATDPETLKQTITALGYQVIAMQTQAVAS